MVTAIAVAIAIGGSGLAFCLWLRERGERRRREVREVEYSKFLAATETSLDGFVILDAVRDEKGLILHFKFQYLNGNAERMVGKLRSELLGQALEKAVGSEAASVLDAIFRQVVETGEPIRSEGLFAEANSTSRWLQPGGLHALSQTETWIKYQAIKLGDGVAMTCSDISAAKASQAQYKHLAEFNHSIFESAPFSMIVTDCDGMITAVNAAAEKLTGYSRSELIGVTSPTILHEDREIESIAEERRGSAWRGMASDGFEMLIARALQGEVEEMESVYLRKDGKRIPISLAVRAVTSEQGEVTGFVGIAIDLTERKEMLDRITHMATHDYLTGLVARKLLQEKTAQAVERARRWGTKVAVFLVDLDQLTRINDLLGHAKGDKVLAEIAGRLQKSVRSSDIVGRLGGDKFAVVMPDVISVADAEQCAMNLVRRIAPAVAIDEHEVHVTASIGVCIYPDYAIDSIHLLKHANVAMYAAKDAGRNQYQIFNEGMLKETADRLSMEHALRHALANGELSLAYQPQVSLATGTVIGMEALLRWNHPKLGCIEPTQFIPLAEETGLIVPIGEWVFQTACHEAMRIREELGLELTISVNLSPRQFQQKDLVEMIERALSSSKLPAQSLEIEITENILMVNSEGNLDKLQKIRDLGMRIAIDDFGTGFCSFTYLLQYQVDRLKIDRSFVKQSVSDANAAAVVRTIIAMSHGLNIKVIAEGVETDEQLRFLLRRRCDEAQGRYFSGPVTADRFAVLVAAMGEHRLAESL